ncbi:hypothetical protein GCM10007304_35740 [Rhodococcoides trifolii]|uniref:Uncharacterized protein n=1 Tax=Rhodococcoides trifolii TaxID=908250 RepID=A0A917LFM6_9NOCA|nr:hypothetical protein GCM10007304_35740 [Rhodococcus trifolii]
MISDRPEDCGETLLDCASAHDARGAGDDESEHDPSAHGCARYVGPWMFHSSTVHAIARSVIPRDYCRVVKSPLVTVIGVVVALAGLLFTLQGFGVIGGSAMSNTTTWSVLGPVVLIVGVVLVVRSRR